MGAIQDIGFTCTTIHFRIMILCYMRYRNDNVTDI